MSFAVIQTGGKQYKVKAGEILKIERIENFKDEKKFFLIIFLHMVTIKVLNWEVLL